MITKIILKNIARWKGKHEINFDEWITLIDWNKGVWKSSLLLDSLKIVFTNSWRSQYFKDIITKGQKEGEIQCFLTVKDTQYMIYWYHKLKEEVIKKDKLWNDKVTSTSAKTIWEVYQYNNEKQEYEKCFNKTPESILWVPYYIASKTFIVNQSDLDAFSKAGPSEKYDIIADSFNISTLFKIGEISQSRINSLVKEKDIYLKNLGNIDTSKFLEIPNKKSQLFQINSTISDYETKIKEKNNTSQTLYNLSRESLSYIDKNNELNNQTIFLHTLKKYLPEIDSITLRLAELEELIEKEDPSFLLKYETDIETLKGKKLMLEEKFNSELDSFEKVFKVKDTSYITKLSELQRKYNSLKEDYSYLLTLPENFKEVNFKWKKIWSFSSLEEFFNLYKEEDLWEYLNSVIDEERKILQNIEKEIFSLISWKEKINWTLTKLNNLTCSHNCEGNCPTCYQPLKSEDLDLVKNTFISQIAEIDKKIEDLNNNKLSSSSIISINNSLIELYHQYKRYQEFLECKNEGQTLNQEYIKFKEEGTTKRNEIKEKYEWEIKDLSEQILQKYTDYEKLKSQSNLHKYKEEQKTLNSKSWVINNYKLDREWIKSTILVTQNTINELETYLNSIIPNIKLENSEKTSYKDILEEYNNKINNDIQNINIEINKLNEEKNIQINSSYELKNEVELLEKYQKDYLAVQGHIDTINEKLKKLERLSIIFGKKWHPKKIIEEIILPELENETNKILERTTDGQYSVSFSLSSLTSEWRESKKNTFDIIVDVEGVEQNYDSLSWWEKVLLNYAIRLWITECLNHILGEKVTDILILDEAFLAIESWLNAENIFTSIRETSRHYSQIFVITHEEVLKEKLIPISNIKVIVKEWNYSKLLDIHREKLDEDELEYDE